MIAGREYHEYLFEHLIGCGRLSHGYLFFGDPGIGKRLFTERLAARLEFGSFQEESPRFLDAQWFSRDPDASSIGIDAVRGIRNFLYQTPLRSPRRLAVIDGAEVVTSEAQSALLKIVEEPPHYGCIIFIAEREHSLLAPLASRLQKFYFPRFSTASLARLLEDRFGFAKQEADALARRSFGRVGRALRLGGKISGDAESRSDARGLLLEELRERIADVHGRGILDQHRYAGELIRLETALSRFSLNPSLQRKVASFLETRYCSRSI